MRAYTIKNKKGCVCRKKLSGICTAREAYNYQIKQQALNDCHKGDKVVSVKLKPIRKGN